MSPSPKMSNNIPQQPLNRSMNFTSSRAHSRQNAMATLDPIQKKRLTSKIKLYASLNPSPQFDTVNLMRNTQSSYSRKNFQLQPISGPRLGTGNKIQRSEKIKYAKTKETGYLEQREQDRYLQKVLQVNSKLKKYLDLSLLNAILAAQCLHSSSRMPVTSRLATWSKRVMYDTLATMLLTRQCSNAVNVQKNFPRVIEMITDLIEVQRCAAFLYDEEENEIYLQAISGIDVSSQKGGFVLQKKGPFNEIFHEKSGYILFGSSYFDEEVEDLERYDATIIDAELKMTTRNQLLVALKQPGSGAVIGFLQLANKKHGKQFTQLDLHVLKLVAKSLGKGVSNFQRAQLLNEKNDLEKLQVQKLNNDLLNEYVSPIMNQYLTMIEGFINKNAGVSVLVKDGEFLKQFNTRNHDTQSLVTMPISNGLSGRAIAYRLKVLETPACALDPQEQLLLRQQQHNAAVVLIPDVFEQELQDPTGLIEQYDYEQSSTKLERDQKIIGCLFISTSQALSHSQKKKLPKLARVISQILYQSKKMKGFSLNSIMSDVALSCINEGLVWINTQLNVTKLNAAFQSMIRKKGFEVVGKSVTEIFGNENVKVLEKINQTVDSGQSQIFENILFKVDEQSSVRVNFYALLLSEKIQCILLIFQPIILIKKQQEFYNIQSSSQFLHK